jgi:hypothetical protein
MHPSPKNKIVVLSIALFITLGSYWLVKKTSRDSGTSEMGQRSIASQNEKNAGTPVSNSTNSKSNTTATGSIPGGSVAGTPGSTTDQKQAPSGTEAAAQPETAKKLTENCFTVTYVHKKISSHSDGEACLRHKNLIVLNHPEQAENTKINTKSVCIRVNGAATKFAFVPNKSNQVIIGPEAGPHAKITARYCVGKSLCQEDCTIKKDEFMAALGADDSDAAAVDWDGSKEVAKEDSELENEMAKLNGNAEKRGGSSRPEVFEGWISEAHAMACEQKSSGNKKVAHLSTH